MFVLCNIQEIRHFFHYPTYHMYHIVYTLDMVYLNPKRVLYFFEFNVYICVCILFMDECLYVRIYNRITMFTQTSVKSLKLTKSKKL